jgi:hypothetical protein
MIIASLGQRKIVHVILCQQRIQQVGECWVVIFFAGKEQSSEHMVEVDQLGGCLTR